MKFFKHIKPFRLFTSYILYPKSYILGLIPILFLISYLLYPHNVRAQEMVRTLTISPPTIEKTLDKGQRAEGIIKIINDSANPLTFSVSVQDFIVDDNQGVPHLLPPNTLANKYSAASWIGVSPSTITVPSHAKKEINYYLQIPPQARPGGHYAAVILNPATSLKLQGTGASVQTLIGSLFYIQVKGPIMEKALVSKFKANSFQEYGPIRFETQIKNEGDLHIKPQGFITITNTFGNKSYTLPLKAYNIFPGASRDYTNTLEKTFLLGRYKATLTAFYGQNRNLPLSATIYFWVFPWKVALVIVFVVIALVLGFLLWRRKKGKGPTELAVNKEVTPEQKEEPAAQTPPADNLENF